MITNLESSSHLHHKNRFGLRVCTMSMCDYCVPSTPLTFSVIKIQKLGLSTSTWRPSISTPNYGTLHLVSFTSKSRTRGSRNPGVVGSEGSEIYSEIGLKQKVDNDFELNKVGLDSAMQNGTEEDLFPKESSQGVTLKEEETVTVKLWRGRQVMRRSNMVAKQVISIHSALTLGFVSQLWVDTNSWVVLVVEVRPNLLSGESERFYLEDVNQFKVPSLDSAGDTLKVGDVVLIEDESVMENEIRMVGLETLVGYKVVTTGRRNIGKVRGFTFNINSGAVESLELDSFGVSIIPSSLVSTYALLVEDVLEVVSDTIVVHEAAASRVQRLTKGFWDTQNVGTSIDELGEYSDFERPVRSNHGQGTKRSFSNRKFRQKMRENEDDWELPMDYL